MKVGLTLGKFAPLHRGHEWMIETALAEVDHLIVVIYHCPETTDCPLPIRAAWLRDLFPKVEVLEAWDGPTEVGDAPEITQLHDAYLQSLLAGRRITHFFSSEFYGAHVSAALACEDRRVDPGRLQFAISGTAIRTNPFAHRKMINPRVYRDLVTKVVLLGAPSTGKTTLARELARQYGTVWMPEYGREYWESHQQDRRLTPEQLVEIALGHREREDNLVNDADRYLFVDTNATTTQMFSRYYHGDTDGSLVRLAEDCRTRYDLHFLCEPDFPYADTWDRSGATHQRVFHEQTRADLACRKIPFISLNGCVEERVARVRRVLEGFEKFTSLGNCLLNH